MRCSGRRLGICHLWEVRPQTRTKTPPKASQGNSPIRASSLRARGCLAQEPDAGQGWPLCDAVEELSLIAKAEVVGVAGEVGEVLLAGVCKAPADLQAAIVEIGHHEHLDKLQNRAAHVVADQSRPCGNTTINSHHHR